MIHHLPETPAFRDEASDSPISEIALRVLVEFKGGETHVIGTATLIGGYLAITVKHVLEHALQEFGVQKKTINSAVVREYAIRLYQVMPGPVYRVWNVCMAWYSETDIAILHLGLSGTSESDPKIDWRGPCIRATPPPVGQKIIAFGYRQSVAKTTPNEAGGYHLDLQDKPCASFGEVKKIYAKGRDSVMLPFPCYEVNARLDPGMSGGLVIDEFGALCGLICASMPGSGPGQEAVSHITTLWPMLRTLISADRAGDYPKGVRYPMIDLALNGIIHVTDLDKLNPNEFPGRILPIPQPNASNGRRQP